MSSLEDSLQQRRKQVRSENEALSRDEQALLERRARFRREQQQFEEEQEVAMTRGQTPDVTSARHVDELRDEWRRLQRDVSNARRTVDALREERADLEQEVLELRSHKTSHERRDDVTHDRDVTRRIERAEREVRESAGRRAKIEAMSDMASPSPTRDVGRASRLSTRMGGGAKTASLDDLLDLSDGQCVPSTSKRCKYLPVLSFLRVFVQAAVVKKV